MQYLHRFYLNFILCPNEFGDGKQFRVQRIRAAACACREALARIGGCAVRCGRGEGRLICLKGTEGEEGACAVTDVNAGEMPETERGKAERTGGSRKIEAAYTQSCVPCA